MKTYPYVEVVWDDHSTDNDVAFDKPPQTVVVTSRGWLIHENETHLVLGNNMAWEDEQGDRMTILKAAVVRRRHLKVSRVAAARK